MTSWRRRAAVLLSGLAAAEFCFATQTRATTYTDATGAADHFSDGWADIANVQVTNDATTLTFVVNLNPFMNDGVTPNNIQNNNFTKYDIGFHTGPGGSTALQGAYEQVMGLSTGMNYWVRGWADQNAAPSTLGGYQLFHWDGTGWGTFTTQNGTGTVTPTSVSMTFNLADLGLSAGSSFNFDVWTTFNGVQGAYDALDNPNLTPGFPYSNGDGTPTPYDGASGPNYATTIYTVVSSAVSGQWTGATDNTWSNPGNWTGGVPNGVDHIATFGANSSANFAISVDGGGKTVGAMNFDNATSYTIGSNGGNAITFQVSTGQAAINVVSGSHTIAAPVTLASDTTITSAPGSGVALTGNLTATGRTITKAGDGSVLFQNVRAATLNVSSGSAKISAKGTANSSAGTSVVQSLSINAGANLDLANNSMIIDYTGPIGTQLTDVRGHLKNGRLTTSSGTATTRLGYADNTVLNKTTFAGQSVDTSSILLKYTYAGDADLDGDADGVDIGTWATNFTGELGGSGSAVWTQGDWDYDGDVDGVDAGLWAQAFTGELGGAGLGSLVINDPGIAPGAAAILRGMGITVVPEPATFVGVGLALLAVSCRRRRFVSEV